MATKTSWKSLNPKQRKIGVKRWHQRKDAATGTPSTQSVAAAQDANPLYAPSVQLSGHALAAAAAKLAGLEINPALKALDQQAKTTRQQGGALEDRAAGYYTDLNNRDTTNQAAAQAISDRLNTQLAGIGTDTSTQLANAGADEQSRLQADAQQRGTGLDGGAVAQAATEQAALQDRAATATAAMKTSGALQGGSQEALVNAIASAGQLKGGETQTQLVAGEQNALGQIAAQRAAEAAKRGPTQTKYVTDLRQSAFENLITQQGLKIKNKQLAQDAATSEQNYALAVQRALEGQRHDKAGETISQQNADTSAARFASQEEKDAYQRLHQLGPYKPARAPGESVTSHNLKRGIGNVLDTYSSFLAPGKLDSKGHHYTLAKIDAKLQAKGVAPDVLAAGRDLAQFGYVTPATIKQLKIAGVTNIPSSWAKTGAATYGAPTG